MGNIERGAGIVAVSETLEALAKSKADDFKVGERLSLGDGAPGFFLTDAPDSRVIVLKKITTSGGLDIFICQE